jgi:hypothetical protein
MNQISSVRNTRLLFCLAAGRQVLGMVRASGHKLSYVGQ